MQIAFGTYTGNGINPHVITLGFRPCAILQGRMDGSGGASWVVNAGGVDRQKITSNGAPSNLISTTATGFSLNTTGVQYNQNTSQYAYLAFSRDAAMCDTFSYVGNGGSNRNVGALAFQPDLAVFLTDQSSRQPIWWIAAQGNKSCYWADGSAGQSPLTNGIVGAHAAGLTVSPACNANLQNCYMFALKCAGSGLAAQLAYTGNGVNNHNVAHGLSARPAAAVVQSFGSAQDGTWRNDFDISTGNSHPFFSGTPATGELNNLDATNLVLGTAASSNANAISYGAFFALAGATASARLRTLTGAGV